MEEHKNSGRKPDAPSSKRRILSVIAQVTVNQVIGWLVRHWWG